MTFTTGQAVNLNGTNGIVEDDHIRTSGAKKGKINVLFVGSRYGFVTVAPDELTAGWVF